VWKAWKIREKAEKLQAVARIFQPFHTERMRGISMKKIKRIQAMAELDGAEGTEGGGTPVQARTRTEAEVLRAYEDARARIMRGHCEACGHTWRPRNPSTAQVRCPSCARRGVASFTHHEG
jgi:rubrerythrin